MKYQTRKLFYFQCYIIFCSYVSNLNSQLQSNHTIFTPTEGNQLSPEAALHELLKNYVRTERPKYIQQNATIVDENPLSVEVNLYILSFSSISVVNMDFTVDFMLRQRWLDPRLRLADKYNFTYLPISYQKNSIWIPDLFFRNAKHGYFHDITTPNYLIWLHSNGVVTFSQKISMKFFCHMILQSFPLDTQTCLINIGSYGYPTKDLNFIWWKPNTEHTTNKNETTFANTQHEQALQIRKDIEINEFDLLSSEPQECRVEYSTTGSFSCLEAKFQLKRRFGFYLIYAYLPSLLVAIIAWLSFFVDPEAVPARISIGLLCVLALITQSAAVLTQVPPVSYVKAIDIWFFVCLAFVVSSLLEFAIANQVIKKSKEPPRSYHKNVPSKKVKRLKTNYTRCRENLRTYLSETNLHDMKLYFEQSESLNPIELVGNKGTDERATSCSISPYEIHPAFLDRIFAICYPIVFLLFTVGYWLYFLKF